jgi:uncharacterized LabA/DUF88 family protein
VSKNVAVFVDVANIFYAAKAAGIDIDYVTLLKSATAGRDFVRAYAYTGLDPENENQRQFHSFLARNGYKVISKDIRKYGDGRIKANLDIELVVDMMKTARNLDIAVVVSGDGDFAPAIRAVQEQGVRVEVISFRGNTSSDLIDVADQFTDIAQIARVEKSSARSGRRVAAEGDLSMTEVPEKETEGAPRRRRGRGREDRFADAPPAAIAPAAAAASAAAGQANLVVLPGERLSRRSDAEEIVAGGPMDLDEVAELIETEPGEFAAGSENGHDALGEDGRRRRRRRGGRGRGRGRRGEGDSFAPSEAGVASVADTVEEDDEEFEDAQPTQPPHHTFGSVWDSQIGVPSTPAAGATSASLGEFEGDEDEDLEEPEVPEYLLAERRQRGQRPGAGGRGGRTPRGRSAYQAALDRERYGNRAPQPTFGGSGTGSGGSGGSGGTGGRSDRGPSHSRDRGRGGRPQGGRPTDRSPRSDNRPVMPEQRSSAEPWSEVPPELEELLRAEMARKSPGPESRSAYSAPAEPQSAPTAEADVPSFSATPDDEPAKAPVAKAPRRTRTTKATATAAPAAVESAAAEASPAAEKPKARATRARTTKTTTTKSSSKASASNAAGDSAEVAPAPKKPATRRKSTAKTAPEEG